MATTGLGAQGRLKDAGVCGESLPQLQSTRPWLFHGCRSFSESDTLTEVCSQLSDIVVCGNGTTGEMQDAEFRTLLQGMSSVVNFMLHLTRRI